MNASIPLFNRSAFAFNHIACGDAVEWLGTIADEAVDLVVTDPAYSSLEKHRAVGTTTRLKVSAASSNKWFPVVPNSYFPAFFREIYRVLKPNTHLYFLCDQETMFIVKPMGEAAGFKFWKPIVWDKLSVGLGYHFRCQYEFILFFEKGKRRLNDLGMADVISEKRVRGSYPTEKPVPLLEKLVAQSSKPGELVCDPFMGSGSSLVAAKNLGRRYAGCDISPEAVELTRKRLEDA